MENNIILWQNSVHGGNAQADTLLCGDVWNHADVAFHGGVCDWISGVLAGSTLTLILVNACSLGRTLDAQVKSFILYILHAVQSHSLPPTLHSTECLLKTSPVHGYTCKCTDEVESTALHPPSFNIEWNAFLQHVATLFRYYWVHLGAYEYGVKKPVTFRVFKIQVNQ